MTCSHLKPFEMVVCDGVFAILEIAKAFCYLDVGSSAARGLTPSRGGAFLRWETGFFNKVIVLRSLARVLLLCQVSTLETDMSADALHRAQRARAFWTAIYSALEARRSVCLRDRVRFEDVALKALGSWLNWCAIIDVGEPLRVSAPEVSELAQGRAA